MRLILPILIISYIFTSCSNKNQYSATEFQADSIAIINNFEQALLYPDSFGALNEQNKALAEANKDLEDTYYYNLAEYYTNVLKYDSALLYINIGLDQFKDTMNANAAKYYNLLSIRTMYTSDIDSSIYYTNKAIRIFEREGQDIPAGVMYVNMSDVFKVKGDFKSAYEYGLKGLQLLEKNNDTLYRAAAYSMMAVAAYHHLQNVDSANYYNQKAIVLSDSLNNNFAKVSSILTQGEIHGYQKDWNTAIQYFEEAITLSLDYGLYEIVIKGYNNISYAYTQVGEYEKALTYLRILKGMVDEENMSMIYDVHLSFVSVFEKLGNVDSAYYYLREAEQEYREIANQENQRNVQQLLISYEDQKKTAQIAEQAQTINRALIVLIILGVIVFTLFIVIYVKARLRKAKQRLQAEKHQRDILESMAMGEEKERRRISHELHNGVAAQLTGIKFNLESIQNESITLPMIIEQVIKTHKEVRSIAHNLNPIDFNKVTLFEAITSFVNDVNIIEEKIHLYVGINECDIPAQKAKVLYRLVQEFVQNALKYSQSERIFVNCISLENGACQITVEDEGIGFDVAAFREKYKDIVTMLLQPLDIEVMVNSHIGEGSIMRIQF